MRFIGAMMNALGSLLPLRGSTAGTPGPQGIGRASETADGPQGTDSGSFASTLLQMLSPKAPVNGKAPELGGQILGGGGEGPVPGSPIPPDSTENGSVVSGQSPTESRAEEGTAGTRAGSGTETLSGSLGSEPGTVGSAPNPAFPALRPSTPAPAPAGPGHDSAPAIHRTDRPQDATGPDQPFLNRAFSGISAGADPKTQAASVRPGSIERGRVTEVTSLSGREGVKESQPTSAAGGESLEAVEVDGPSAPERVKSPASAESFPVDRDPANLDPEFRQRLDRVVSRMENEFGHKVQMVEGFRTPQRQKAIYAQGRTQPGPVATWTTESLHSRGRAADLQVDGSWDNPAGYARLQQVAKEEGLGVLGNKDPGHLELPGEGLAKNQTRRSAGWEASPSASHFSRTARVARVASTARVARPAAVGGSRMPPANLTHQNSQAPGTAATVSPSGPGSSIPEPPPKVLNFPVPDIRVEVPERGPIQVMGKPAQALGPTGPSSQNAARLTVQDGSAQAGRPVPGQEAAFSRPGNEIPGGPRTEEPDQNEPLRLDTNTQPGRQGNEPNLASDASRIQGTRPLNGVESIQRATTADRVQEILTASETWDTQAAGRLLVDLDDADGAGTRLRLALRGSELAGTLDLTDPALAGRMRQRIGELHEALSKQGLDGTRIEARALSGIDGRGAADGDLATLLKDPLTGLARILETRDPSPQNRGGDPRQAREDSQRGFERFKDAPQRDRNKENQR